jgi:hypothetical protein
VARQPANPAQTCTPQSASGTIDGADVTDVSVVCSTESFTIGGVVSGLEGAGLVLRRNGEEDLPIASNGAFTFANAQASGTTYDIAIAAQPTNPVQTCTVSDASGTVGSGDARSVRVTCATDAYVIGGTVAGLEGDPVVLANSSDTVEVQADGAFTFPTPVASGGGYSVSVQTHPADPPQSCTVTNGEGTVTDADVTNIEVSCALAEFTIGVTVSGVAGTGLRLQNNGADDLAITGDGAFTFATAVASGRPYAVTVATQPTGPAQECTVVAGEGVVELEDITNVEVHCVTVEFTVGGSVAGLAGSGLVLRNNGADDLAIAANGGFTFATSLRTGAPYAVSVAAQPANPTQVCTVTDGSGTVTDANIGAVKVQCETSRFPIQVSVSGLQGFNLRVRSNTGDTMTLFSNGTHTFPTQVLSGEPYEVVVVGQPILPFQTCTPSAPSGIVGATAVTVPITCE